MTTLDDKLLGEKCQYYYSSSSDDEEDSDQDRKIREGNVGESDGGKEGSAVNTGPKGVINDWRRYKQLENEQNEEQKRELEQLVKRLSMTCKSQLDEEKDKQKQKELEEKLHGKMSMQEYNMHQQDDEDFLEQYRRQRIEEMKQQLCHSQVYKKVFDISSGEEFLDTVDNEPKNTLVIILIYEDEIPGAEAASGSIMCLASEYPGVKFCRVKSSLLGTSSKFTKNALPALLVYKSGELIGNFVRITDQLGEDFFAVDLEAFLHECSLLPEKDLVRTSICNPSIQCYSDDSDLDID
ncbi:phosducin-like protein [Leptodactylus fuscus]|uniref:phosducin-like protein n=1 Tax=Leptodactylus fuscus TaxID=238119 RepID=UPI003F4E8DF6